MFDEASALPAPTDEQLAIYLGANADEFRSEPRVTFTQIFLDPRRRANTLVADAARLRDALSHSASKSAAGAERALAFWKNASKDDGERRFGREFATALFAQTSGKWVGPIPSAYGMHLVRVDSMVRGSVAALAAVRPAVEREWTNARRKERSDALYARLREKYIVRVTPTVVAGGVAGTVWKQWSRTIVATLLLVLLPTTGSAHDGPAFLSLREGLPGRYDIVWKVPSVGSTNGDLLSSRQPAVRLPTTHEACGARLNFHRHDRLEPASPADVAIDCSANSAWRSSR